MNREETLLVQSPRQVAGHEPLTHSATRRKLKLQEIAYLLDDGYTLTCYSGDQLIDIGSNSFRDLKLFWHSDTKNWAMVVAHSSELFLAIYTSPDLKPWTHASNFPFLRSALGLLYECLTLIRISLRNPLGPVPDQGDMYVRSVRMSANPGSPAGSSTMQCFPGTFNGTHFVAVDGFFFGTPEGDDDFLPWAANLQYMSLVPTAQEGWCSAMTLPRRTFLTNASQAPAGWNLVTLPVDSSPAFDLDPSAVVQQSWNGSTTVELDLSGIASGAFYFEINATNLHSPTGPSPSSTDVCATVTFMLSSSVSGESLSGRFLFELRPHLLATRSSECLSDSLRPSFRAGLNVLLDLVFQLAAVVSVKATDGDVSKCVRRSGRLPREHDQHREYYPRII
ncbi:hypothetical protein V8D89_002422 [Ganoderma adspersum]